MEWGSGVPHGPSLVFLERLNGKPLADGRLPRRPTPRNPISGPSGPRSGRAPSLFAGGQLGRRTPLHRAPLRGIKVQRAPPGGGRHGEGPPRCKALAGRRGRGSPEPPTAAPWGSLLSRVEGLAGRVMGSGRGDQALKPLAVTCQSGRHPAPRRPVPGKCIAESVRRAGAGDAVASVPERCQGGAGRGQIA